jgi:hypothetical protein
VSFGVESAPEHDRDEAKPREVYVSQSRTKSVTPMLTLERLQMIAVAIVQINAMYDGTQVPLELAEYWACRILLDEDERES